MTKANALRYVQYLHNSNSSFFQKKIWLVFSVFEVQWRNLSILIEILLITYIDVGQLSILFTPDNSFFGDEKMIFKSKESFPITTYQT